MGIVRGQKEGTMLYNMSDIQSGIFHREYPIPAYNNKIIVDTALIGDDCYETMALFKGGNAIEYTRRATLKEAKADFDRMVAKYIP